MNFVDGRRWFSTWSACLKSTESEVFAYRSGYSQREPWPATTKDFSQLMAFIFTLKSGQVYICG